MQSFNNRFVDLLMLYVCRAGTVLASFFALPYYNYLLRPEAFGEVTFLLTLQAFLVTLDMGMATVVGREYSNPSSNPESRIKLWQAAEIGIISIYAIIGLIVLAIVWISSGLTKTLLVFACIILFLSLTLHNIGQSALIGRRLFRKAAVSQMYGLLIRHGTTLLALMYVEASFGVFVIVQSMTSAVQLMITRYELFNDQKSKTTWEVNEIITQIRRLVHDAKYLVVFTFTGAAAMQCDKLIVGWRMSPEALGPYFLASSFCLIPLSIFTAPVAQFFQPRIIEHYINEDDISQIRTLKNFCSLVIVCTLVPTAIMWIYRNEIINIWLHQSNDVGIVAEYVGLLLPGIAVGAAGYVPFTLLTAKQRYRFQSGISSILTISLLSATFVCASSNSLVLVCIICSTYHVSSTLLSWYKCVCMDSSPGGPTMIAARYAIISTATVFLITGLVSAVSKAVN